ncbi:uncharacterized protein LOC143296547 [Babylonia areolata]|uniref:uncharacterized protein LOC143296547 n=1 Tax=Babylonia areolata TaxID=304850 RepID=UPI003FD55A11
MDPTESGNESTGDVACEELHIAAGRAPDDDDNNGGGGDDPRHRLTTSHSRSEIMLGLQTDEGQSAEVEIDSADQEDLMPESEIPKGKVRKASITDKVIKTKASEAIAAVIKEEAENRQRRFEKLLDEHAELVQEIQRSASSENLIPGERDQ